MIDCSKVDTNSRQELEKILNKCEKCKLFISCKKVGFFYDSLYNTYKENERIC